MVLASALVLLVVGVLYGGPTPTILDAGGGEFDDPSSEAIAASSQIERASGEVEEIGLIAVVRTGTDVNDSRARNKVQGVASVMRTYRSVARVFTYYDTRNPAMVSRDRRSTFVGAVFKAGVEDEAGDIAERLEPQPGVVVGGPGLIGEQTGETVGEDLAKAEAIAFPILFIVSLFIFRSVVAALLPLMVGILTILGTFTAMRLINEIEVLSVFALNLVIALGLALAIDYSLFMVSRYREEMARSGPGVEALRTTMATAGRTVLFSAGTVAAALLALAVFPMKFLDSMAIGGIATALIAALISLTVLPATIAALGPRVNSLAPARWKRAAESSARPARSGGWYRLAHWIMRRPGPIALVVAVLLVAAGTPFLGIKFTGVDVSVLPPSTTARQVSDILQREFPSDPSTPVEIAASAPRSAAGEVEAYARQLGRLAGVESVEEPRALRADTWALEVIPRGSPLTEQSKDLVRNVRATDAPFPVKVGGETAAFLDNQASLGDSLPLALAVLAVLTVLALFLMTGSVVLPIKTLIMNLLTVSATFGILVLIFQDGNLESLLGFTSQGAIESTQPILIFALAFGLSTDYGVFLLTRIKEARDGGLDNREAVALGLERTGRLVTYAALLFCIAIGAFATSQIVFIKMVGVGVAAAVLIDATLVRAFLVPSLMALLGERNWWAPRWLRRVHDRFGVREEATRPGEA